MRIRHIYITKEGEPMANPEMEYPTLYFISGGHEVARTDLDEALAKYHSGLLPFEDKDRAKWHILQQNRDIVIFGQARDTLIPVDIEVEVVEYRVLDELDKLYDIRKVLRVKP